MLDAASIIAEAEDTVCTADTDCFVRTNLERLCLALLQEGGQSEDGQAMTRANLLRDTVARLEGLKWLADYPDIADERIDQPVFLMGLPRSGTTYFQYLFDRDYRFRLIRTWESLTPFPPPGHDLQSARKRKQEWAAIREKISPSFEGFEALHLIDEDGSDECHAFLEQSFGAAGLNNLYRVPGYFDYLLDEADLAASYRVHKRQLQLLQWKVPTGPWALKYPNHVLAMNEILEVNPTARMVMTHRDPVQTLASISKMTYNLRGLRVGKPVDKAEVGRDMLHFISRHIDRIMEFDASANGQRVVHVDYYDLVADPVGQMHRIHKGIGMDTPEDVAAAVGAWHAANPKNKRGANPYTLEEYGLDAAEIAERFSPYMCRFNIPREVEGLARIAAQA